MASCYSVMWHIALFLAHNLSIIPHFANYHIMYINCFVQMNPLMSWCSVADLMYNFADAKTLTTVAANKQETQKGGEGRQRLTPGLSPPGQKVVCE